MSDHTDDFQLLREHLMAASTPPPDVFEAPVYRRLARALAAAPQGSPDLAALIRQVIRRESERSGVQQALRLPAADGLTTEQWREFGVEALGAADGTVLLRARPWRPSWLRLGPGDRAPEAAACAEEQRRTSRPCPGDPFLRRLGREQYLNRGQQEAVRAVLSAPPASTLAVVLPTGSGKSLCAHVLSQVPLSSGAAEGVTIVVVPTVALAVDQTRTVEELIGHRCDYVGGSDPAQQAQNAEIRARLRQGTQKLVFTSPESLLGSLRPAAYEAAQAGLLKALVIDEAHLVEKWGDEFRPAFQQLAGLRRGLLECAPEPRPVTLLLSATVTQSCLETLEALFGAPGPFAVSAAVSLRPEPSFWISSCEHEQEKHARVHEALRHVPRPAILYTTRVGDAERWHRDLKAAGFRRLDVMTGKTSQSQRDRLVRDWATGELDLVVATSAFGLGVDQNEVRTIIHACVPETADRYYQEVGRAGRDGLASLSLVIYDPVDLKTGGEMSRSKLIRGPRGGQRWRRMFEQRQETARPGLYEVDFSVTPGFIDREIDMAGRRHEAWNARTVTLLARAGLIELADLPPQGTDEAVLDHSRCGLRVLDDSHCDPVTWEQRVEPERRRTQAAEIHQWQLMRRILNGRGCVGAILEEMYRLRVLGAEGHRQELPVGRSCGGCADCRATGVLPFAGNVPPRPYPWAPQNHLGGDLATLVGDNDVLALFGDAYAEKGPDHHLLLRVVGWLVEQGVRVIAGPGEALAVLAGPGTPLAGQPVFLQPDEAPWRRGVPRLPTLQIAPRGRQVPLSLSLEQRMRPPRDGAPLTIWLCGSECVSLEKPQALLSRWLPCPRHSLADLDRQLQL